MYESLMVALAPDFWCIAPDTPGFGLSDSLLEEGSIAGYATAVYTLLKSLNIESCWVFGHHTGAAIAVELAFGYPDLVEKLVLSGPPLLTDAQIAFLKTTLPEITLDENGRFLQEIWQRLRKKNPDGALDLILRETITSLQCWDSYHEAYHAVFAQNFRQQIASLTCAVLLMAGEQDSLFTSLEPAAQLVQNSCSHTTPNAGTYICDEQPQLVADLLRKFFLE